MKKTLGKSLMVLTALALQACGGGSGGGAAPSISTEPPTPGAAQVFETIENSVMGLFAGFVDTGSFGTMGAKATQTQTFPCANSGNVKMTISENGASATMGFEHTACAGNLSEMASDGVCSFDTVIDGNVDCSVTATYNGTVETAYFDCGTASACTGLTVTIEGVPLTAGFDVTNTVTTDFTAGTQEAVTTGTLCVEGVNYDIDAFSDGLVGFTLSELVCQ